MKIYLFPQSFKPVGWAMFIVAAVAHLLCMTDVVSLSGASETAVNDGMILLAIAGALFVTCSKVREEDEMTRHIRLTSLLTALYVYSALLIVATLMVSGLDYFYVMAYNLVLLFVVYIVVYERNMWKFRHESDEE